MIISVLLIGTSYSSHYLVQNISAKKSSSSEKASSTSTSSSSSNTTSIALNALEKNETYRWQNASKAINPTLYLKANTDYIIKIKNPTDTKHELIIVSNGTEIAKSNEVDPGKTGKLSLPVNSTGTLEYHCEYHPDTMKGIIEISGQ